MLKILMRKENKNKINYYYI